MTIHEALRQSHDRQRKLLEQLVQTHGECDERTRLFDEVARELKAHAAAEERHFYVPLIEVDKTQEKSRHSIAEHHEFDEMIETLTETDQSSPAWLATASHLHERVVHHLDEEEQEVFPLSEKVLTKSRQQTLAVDYNAQMQALSAQA